jgi:hypothetical protein
VPIVDHPNYRKLIGAELNYVDSTLKPAGFFHGFVWEFCAYSTKKISFDDDLTTTPDCGTGAFCTTCPPDKDAAPDCTENCDECLIDCEWDEYLDDNNEC